jgi:hypothetical protein
MQKPREPALCLRLWNQSRAISCGNQFRFQSLAIGTSPVPVPWNRNQSLCYSALLFLLLLRLLRLLLVGVCQILTLHMFLYQQLLFLCPTSLPGVVELVFTVFGCVVSTSFCCCCCCCCCSLLFVEWESRQVSEGKVGGGLWTRVAEWVICSCEFASMFESLLPYCWCGCCCCCRSVQWYHMNT